MLKFCSCSYCIALFVNLSLFREVIVLVICYKNLEGQC